MPSLYFDITKDCLYADSVTSFDRRAVVTVLERVSIKFMLPEQKSSNITQRF